LPKGSRPLAPAMKDLLGRSWPHRSRCGCVASIEGRCYCRNPGRPPAVL